MSPAPKTSSDTDVRYDQYGFAVQAKPPRPEARTGATLVMAGGVVHIIAVFLPWYQGGGITLKGMDTYVTADGLDQFDAPGKLWIVVGAVLFALGAITFYSGRRLAIALAATLISVLGLFSSLLGVGVAKNQRDFLKTGDAAIGAFIGIIAILAALAGSIQILAKRRR